ncbi:MAG: S41 family peptidase [bacterium]
MTNFLVRLSVLLLVAVASLFLGMKLARSSDGSGTSDLLGRIRSMQNPNLVKKAFDLLDRDYYTELDAETKQQMEYAAVTGMLSVLREEPYNDDFTHFYNPELYQDLNAQTTGEYAGVGILMGLSADGHYPELVTVFPNTPAEEVGLLKNDVIAEIEGEDTFNMILPEVASKIKGPIGSKVKVKIFRAGEPEFMDFEIERRNVEYSSVAVAEMYDGGVGYIKISNFAEETGPDFRRNMEELSAQGMSSLIIDLRDNTGGVLTAARDVADCFVEEGMIVEVETRNSDESARLGADPNTEKFDVPIVILINDGTASASEVLTQALVDYGKAKVVGEKSFGKGVVQAVIPMDYDEKGDEHSALAVVIGKYYTPSHTEIHKEGISPNIWYDVNNQLRDDAYLRDLDERIIAKSKEIQELRTELTRYLRANDAILTKGEDVARKLASGIEVADEPKLEPEEDMEGHLTAEALDTTPGPEPDTAEEQN